MGISPQKEEGGLKWAMLGYFLYNRKVALYKGFLPAFTAVREKKKNGGFPYLFIKRDDECQG